MRFKIIALNKNTGRGNTFVGRARSRKRAIRKILLGNPNLKNYLFYFKYPAEK